MAAAHICKMFEPERAYQRQRLVKLGLAFSHMGAPSGSPAGHGDTAQVCGMGNSSSFALLLPEVLPSARAAPRQTAGIGIHPGGWCDGCSWVRPAT